MRRALAVVLAAAAIGCAAAQPPSLGPLYVESHARPGDDQRFKQTWEGDRLVVDVESESGIGHATFRPGRGVWPDRLAFRLHLRGLESFEAHGTKEFRMSVAEKPLTAPAVVVVPRDVYAGAEALDVRWIDFYR